MRNPGWSQEHGCVAERRKHDAASGHIRISREWKSGDTVELDLDMRIRTERPTPYGHQILMTKVDWGHNYILPVYDEEDPAAKYHIALLRGPVVLAQDSRLGSEIDGAVQIAVDSEGYAEGRLTADIPFPHAVRCRDPALRRKLYENRRLRLRRKTVDKQEPCCGMDPDKGLRREVRLDLHTKWKRL